MRSWAPSPHLHETRLCNDRPTEPAPSAPAVSPHTCLHSKSQGHRCPSTCTGGGTWESAESGRLGTHKHETASTHRPAPEASMCSQPGKPEAKAHPAARALPPCRVCSQAHGPHRAKWPSGRRDELMPLPHHYQDVSPESKRLV